MITREQVADLRPGDVVELRDPLFPDIVSTGPLHADDNRLLFGPRIVRWSSGNPNSDTTAYLTVVSRAPRPFYVNHPRPAPVPGDVVRDADMETRTRVWSHLPHAGFLTEPWVTQSGNEPVRLRRAELPTRLRLLVDGETGMPPAATT